MQFKNCRFPDWWQNWDGLVAAVIASGPTAKENNFAALKGKAKVIAIKESLELYPDADIVYGCDKAWWVKRRGLKEFPRLKLAWDQTLRGEYPDLRFIEIGDNDKSGNAFRFAKPGLLGSGGNSGFQAINLAVQFGATKLILIGFDMHDAGRVHWYGRNNWPGANNPGAHNYRRWLDSLTSQAPVLQKMGIDIVNTSKNSKLKCFRISSIEEALSGWGL